MKISSRPSDELYSHKMNSFGRSMRSKESTYEKKVGPYDRSLVMILSVNYEGVLPTYDVRVCENCQVARNCEMSDLEIVYRSSSKEQQDYNLFDKFKAAKESIQHIKGSDGMLFEVVDEQEVKTCNCLLMCLLPWAFAFFQNLLCISPLTKPS